MNALYNNQKRLICDSRPNKVFSYLVVIMMIGNVYLFPFFKAIDMGEVMIILFIPYFLMSINSLSIKREYNLIYIFVGYSLIVTMLMCALLNGDISSPIVRLTRDFFYYFVIFFLGTHFF